MSTASRAMPDHSLAPFEQLRYAREILEQAAEALTQLAQGLDVSFCRAVELLLQCRGSVVVIGVGKAGLIGQKLSATFASTGARSFFLHPAEAMHGDLGRIHADDVAVVLSFSGESEEITRILPSLVEFGIPVVALTGKPESSLGKSASVVLSLGTMREACWMGLAPSTSTSAMLGLGDALALVVSRAKGFSPRDFLRFHPGGSLGRKLTNVEQVMRPLAECRVARSADTIRAVLASLARPGRRTGAMMLVDGQGVLEGIFTDSDLARLIEQGREEALGRPIAEVMTRSPKLIEAGCSLADACELITQRKLSELPVVDAAGCPIGMIDITDIVGLTPNAKVDDPALAVAALGKGAEPDDDVVLPFPSR